MKLSLLAGVVACVSSTLASPIRRQQNQTYSVPRSLQSILDDADDNPAYQYPTDFTQGIIPKGIHSHNDYWRKAPFFSALSVGAISIEADVWFVNGTLYVGHDQLSLTSTRTFETLYVQPILDVLQGQNPTGQIIPVNTKYGVFDTTPDQTLYLFVDLKTNGAEAWPAVIDALSPLREAGYLSNTRDGTSVQTGAVTVIGTGNTPLDQVVSGTLPRDYFYDANLAVLNSTQANITAAISPIASTQFSRYIGAIEGGGQFNETQLEVLRGQLEVAKQKGIGARYWDTPAWPISTRNNVWRTLVNEGVTLLNADDLPAAAGFAEAAAW